MARDETLRVVFTGGGSGGHVYPLLAVVEALQKKILTLNVKAELTYMGPNDSYARLFTAHGVNVQPVASGKLRRYFSIANFLDAPKVFIGLFQALYRLYRIMPDAVFSKGGTGALPVVVAAWFYRIPVFIHESDSKPGLTNLASARFARKVFVSFASAAEFFRPDKVEVVGLPVRTELLEGKQDKAAAKEALGFNPTQPLTLIVGGSQGAQRINEFIVANLRALLEETQVLHQTGVANLQETEKLARASLVDSGTTRYQAVAYLDENYATALSAADLVVTRSGSSIFELAAFGLPVILIPITESANDHQRKNAYEFSEKGGGVVIEEPNLLPGIFLAQVKTLLHNQEKHAAVSDASAKIFTPGAAEKIADAILRAAA